VVVTALGIERSQREITTAMQSISGEQLAQTPETNLVSALSGKIAGVHIISSNTPGGSARMVIRGVSSLTGNNQPLFGVDGIPVSHAATTSGTRGYNAIDYGNAIQDINPSDIESLTVLMGPNAAGLFYPDSEKSLNRAAVEAAEARQSGASLKSRVWWDR
jgi:outer membrane receptor protein involved in Fe transport